MRCLGTAPSHCCLCGRLPLTPLCDLPDVTVTCQLCATRSARERVREQGAYLILREYHKWETDESALDICEELVNILIK